MWTTVFLVLAAAEPGFSSEARLSGQQRPECKAGAAEAAEEVVVCGRRDNPYRIDKGVMATLPPDPLQQRKRDTGQLALKAPDCPPAGPNDCRLAGKVMVPILPMIIKTIQVVTGTPVREVLRTRPDQYGVYSEVKDAE